MAAPIISVQDLSISFGDYSAVQHIGFDIRSGELLALVGESGSGKSITALSFLKLLPQASYPGGKIIFREGSSEVNLLDPQLDIRAYRGSRIGIIFQEPMTSLNPLMRCGDQIAETLMLHKGLNKTAAWQETLEWLARVQLPDPASTARKYPHQLSGGQKQRIMIAIAICCRPALLICDEPTTALDVTVQRSILDLIKDLQRTEGMTVLFITHDLGVVQRIADRIAIMYRGELIETGSREQIFERPTRAYTRALIACRPAAQPKHQPLPTVQSMLEGGAIETKTYPRITPGEPIVTVDSLKVYYPTSRNFLGRARSWFHAVDGVSFEIRKGETMGLVGESGCGKTTLGRCLLGLIPATSGTIRYPKGELTAMNRRNTQIFRREAQLVFQDPYSSLNPRLQIGEAISEPLMVHHKLPNALERRKRVRQLLDQVQLPAGAERKYPHEFSGGQRQRIVIARALSLEPEFLVCDESVSALDVSVQAQILNLLNELKSELGLTMLFISHDLGVVRYMSDRMMVMRAGKIVEQGDADTIYAHPQHPYTQNLLETSLP